MAESVWGYNCSASAVVSVGLWCGVSLCPEYIQPAWLTKEIQFVCYQAGRQAGQLTRISRPKFID